MRLRRTFSSLDGDGPVTVIFHAGSTKSARGKFLVGVEQLDLRHTVIVFDDSASFHKDMALAHRLRPRGGGRLEADFKKKRILLSGRSQAYGRETNRELTRRALAALFPDFTCVAE